MDKKKFSLIGFGVLAAVIAVILGVTALGKGSDQKTGSSSLPALTVTEVTSREETASAPEQISSVPAETAGSSSAAETLSSSAAPESTSSSGADSRKEYKQYKFRSKKLLDSHYEKHGSEFGSITKDEYLRLANDLLNSASSTVLHKTEKEDGDDVYFDTATGYFLVLSTDGYIRTFFIPDKGIDYYNKQ